MELQDLSKKQRQIFILLCLLLQQPDRLLIRLEPRALTDKNKDGTTELAGAITARNLTIELVDYSNIPTQSYIEVGNEVMYVKSKTSPNKLQVRRAQNGTTAAGCFWYSNRFS